MKDDCAALRFTEKAEEAARFYVSIFQPPASVGSPTSPAGTWPRWTRCAYDAAAA